MIADRYDFGGHMDVAQPKLDVDVLEPQMTSATARAVLTELIGHVLLITINRPEARNAINSTVALGIGNALERAEQDAAVRAVIITGSGNRAFCAGADLRALSRGESLLAGEDAAAAAWGFAGFVNHYISKPTIAAVNGAALGGGTELVLASDLAVAADTAVFGLPEVKRGLIAGGGGAFRMPASLPRKVGLELLLTGDPIDAATALQRGLVNHVAPAEQVLDEALSLAHRIAANAPLAVRASKQVAYGAVGGHVAGEDERWMLSAAALSRLQESADAREGSAAFFEKRPPVWTGQ
jgi:crotonobetainyl-CoA hydratase